MQPHVQAVGMRKDKNESQVKSISICSTNNDSEIGRIECKIFVLKCIEINIIILVFDLI